VLDRPNVRDDETNLARGRPLRLREDAEFVTWTATSGLTVTALEEETPSAVATAAARKIPSDTFRIALLSSVKARALLAGRRGAIRDFADRTAGESAARP